MSILPRLYWKLLILFLGALFCHSLTRLTFYLWNLKEFSEVPWFDLAVAFLWGLRFDLSASAAILSPVMLLTVFLGPALPRRVFNILVFVIFSALLSAFVAINFIDIEMIHFVGRRFNFDTLFIFREAHGKGQGLFKDYGGMILFVSCFLVVLWWWHYKWLFKWSEQGSAGFRLLPHVGWGFVLIALSVVAIRGGLQLKPISFVHTQIHNSSWVNHLVSNSTFTIIKSAGQEKVVRLKYFDSEGERAKYLNSAFGANSLLEGVRPAKPQNVVVIILESFNLEYMGKPHGGDGYTPFLDSLAERSLFFIGGVANGRRSIEGVPSILTGVPTLMDEPFITSPFSSNTILRLPEVLKSRGYHTSFFHGGANGTMYFDSFTKGIGFEHYYGLNEYPDKSDHDGNWGIFDEPFLQFFAQHLNQFPQPFFSAVFTLTSHQPYQIPAKYEGVFPEGPIPILKAVRYTDYSLQKFFETVQKMTWYQDTLFVITADHTHMNFRKEYQNDVSKYKIPILLFHPKMTWPAVDTGQVVQQIDLPLTILDFLGEDPGGRAPLSVSAFVPGDKAAVNYLDGKYYLMASDYFLTWVPGAEPQMYSVSDYLMEHPLDQPADRKELLFNKLKAQIDFHSQGQLDNRLFLEN